VPIYFKKFKQMKNHTKIIILSVIFLSNIFFSCKNYIEEEVIKSPTGQIEKVILWDTKDGKREMVKETRFYPNGNKEREGNYKNDKKNGLWKAWYEDGKIRVEDEFKDGKLHGFTKIWQENGELLYEGKCKEGKADGVWIFYDKDGKKMQETEYKDGQKVSEKKL